MERLSELLCHWSFCSSTHMWHHLLSTKSLSLIPHGQCPPRGPLLVICSPSHYPPSYVLSSTTSWSHRPWHLMVSTHCEGPPLDCQQSTQPCAHCPCVWRFSLVSMWLQECQRNPLSRGACRFIHPSRFWSAALKLARGYLPPWPPRQLTLQLDLRSPRWRARSKNWRLISDISSLYPPSSHATQGSLHCSLHYTSVKGFLFTLCWFISFHLVFSYMFFFYYY